MKLLLDTCTFLWMVAGAPDLSSRVADAVRDPNNEVYLSAAAAMEIAMKHARGRLPRSFTG
jgi:PIN domain nuclease of toxin-antitoxin system